MTDKRDVVNALTREWQAMGEYDTPPSSAPTPAGSGDTLDALTFCRICTPGKAGDADLTCTQRLGHAGDHIAEDWYGNVVHHWPAEAHEWAIISRADLDTLRAAYLASRAGARDGGTDGNPWKKGKPPLGPARCQCGNASGLAYFVDAGIWGHDAKVCADCDRLLLSIYQPAAVSPRAATGGPTPEQDHD